MSETKIEVEWDKNKEIEYIHIPTNPGTHEITETRDWWQWDKKFHTYRTRGEAKVQNGKIEVTLAYYEEDNANDVKDSVWGTLEIQMDLSDTEGMADWYPEGGETYKVNWRQLPETPPSALYENRIRSKRNVINRDENFRIAVLEEDRKCVITGEDTLASLEAAHIIPVAKNGGDVIGNAMILRSDLHRLYDSGFFYIKSDGKIILTEEGKDQLSDHYSSLLSNSKIDTSALKRVHEALKIIEQSL